MEHYNKVQRMTLEIIYRILVKRIAKGYTAEQLSGIICREPGYITSLELLKVPLYSKQELREIAWALGEEDLTAFFPRLKQSAMLNVHMGKEVYENTCIHTCEIITEDGKDVPFFYLQEEINKGSGHMLN